MTSISSFLLAAATALAMVLIDGRADASFDAPKRLAAMLGIAGAMAAMAFTKERITTIRTRGQKAISLCLGAGAALALVSAWVSPHRPVALDTLRTMALFTLIAIIAATLEPAWRWTTHAFIGGAALNAVLTIGERAALFPPIAKLEDDYRGLYSGLVGNRGIAGLVCALAILLLVPRLRRNTIGLWTLVAVFTAAMFINRSATPIMALLAGLVAFFTPYALRRLGAMAAIFLFLVAATDAMHRIDELLTYRIGPWKAALSMIAERPLLGFGAGTFGAEFARHADTEFVNPHLVGSFAQAHNDYLQGAAELGVPAAILAVAALILLIVAARREPALAAILIAGAVAALTWFPLQRPEVAMLLLAACGRAWRNA